MTSIGTVFQPTFPPEQLLATARRAEAAGLDELWVWEDCFKESGIASMTAALAVTERIRVGVGILPMPLRNAALTAMEIATIARLFPGRGRFGVGHGVLDWMGQAGVRAASPLTLMREQVQALRRLLAGEEVSVDGRYVRLDRVRLDWPPTVPVPVLAAGEGPKTLATTGEVADGTVLVMGMPPALVRRAVGTALEARAAAGREGAHEVVVSLLTDFRADGAARMEAELDRWGFEGERRYAATGSDAAVADEVRALAAAGATTVVLQSRSDEEDLPAFVEGAGRVRALIAAR